METMDPALAPTPAGGEATAANDAKASPRPTNAPPLERDPALPSERAPPPSAASLSPGQSRTQLDDPTLPSISAQEGSSDDGRAVAASLPEEERGHEAATSQEARIARQSTRRDESAHKWRRGDDSVRAPPERVPDRGRPALEAEWRAVWTPPPMVAALLEQELTLLSKTASPPSVASPRQGQSRTRPDDLASPVSAPRGSSGDGRAAAVAATLSKKDPVAATSGGVHVARQALTAAPSPVKPLRAKRRREESDAMPLRKAAKKVNYSESQEERVECWPSRRRGRFTHRSLYQLALSLTPSDDDNA